MHYPAFHAPALLRNVHLQNVLSTSSIRRKLINSRFGRLISDEKSVTLEGGNGVRLAADLNISPKNKAAKLAVLLHGWEGSSKSTYILSLAGTLNNAGYDVLRINFRDHGNSHKLNRGIFNSTLLDEVIGAVDFALREYNYENYVVAGFSLGGNFALRYSMRNQFLNTPAQSILAICPVLDPTHTMVALESNWSLYEQYFIKKWKRSLRKKLDHYPDYDYGEALDSMRTLKSMNDYFIPKYTGYNTVKEYFQAYTLTGSALSSIDTRTLIVTSKDDPVNPYSDFTKIARPEKLEVVSTDFGSHCAFLKNVQLESWADDVAQVFFS